MSSKARNSGGSCNAPRLNCSRTSGRLIHSLARHMLWFSVRRYVINASINCTRLIPRFLKRERIWSKSSFWLYLLTAKLVPIGNVIFCFAVRVSVLSLYCLVINSSKLRTLYYVSVKVGFHRLLLPSH